MPRRTETPLSARPLRSPFVSDEPDINAPYSFEQRLWRSNPTHDLVDWMPTNATPSAFRSALNVATTLHAMGTHQLLQSSGFRLHWGWGGAVQWSCPDRARELKPSYRVIGTMRHADTLEAAAMLGLNQLFRVQHVDVALELPRLNLATHTRVDSQLIHLNSFWGTGARQSLLDPDAADEDDDNEGPPPKEKRVSQLGVGLTLKHDLASGVNLLVGYATDVGTDSALVVHADVLRRVSLALRSHYGGLSAGLRLRANLITLHDTSLEFGASYRLMSKFRLKAAVANIGTSLGVVIESVPSTLKPFEAPLRRWCPQWLVTGLLRCGDFDMTAGVTIARDKPRAVGFLSVTAK